ncbi:MAG: SnoaL-like domain-containing protein [Dehalococcoidia bacterium]|nr:SnoaL-like domain-containing protein [Dehalococcoidia bacterium]
MAIDSTSLVKEYLAAWNAHDSETLVSLFTDDCVYEDVALNRLEQGKESVRSLLESVFTDLADFKMDATSAFGIGDWGATEWTMTGAFVHSSVPRLEPTGKRFSVRGATILQLRGGKIVRNSDYIDLDAFLRQTGAKRVPGSVRRR